MRKKRMGLCFSRCCPFITKSLDRERCVCIYIYIGRREVSMETVKRVNEIGKSELSMGN